MMTIAITISVKLNCWLSSILFTGAWNIEPISSEILSQYQVNYWANIKGLKKCDLAGEGLRDNCWKWRRWVHICNTFCSQEASMKVETTQNKKRQIWKNTKETKAKTKKHKGSTFRIVFAHANLEEASMKVKKTKITRRTRENGNSDKFECYLRKPWTI